ncbi:MAG: AraC family ligand binding domain-containing protein [Roseateles asaccharophilus]|jgi:quercetin dioxygenase-like cupin family protein|uniref:Quercetin dioxygenase-like cupin family protein n=1 Tax=Roseateles asaccharophilus TaxID=582607 RepID=A0A4R6N7L5_9BURK|nr:AraC family ligand binding domain-containing protein [Roseateles asaccharophilus]MDN3546066.1 cupin [Roseateles asaccharophilus]TDP11205.1 quercetin dioxygenase-like cupin family protein [Roseateles asaccharophilus]
MALTHAKHGQLIDLAPLADGSTDSPSTSLIKTEQLQLIHMVLHAGQRMPQHKVAGELVLQCLAGRVRLQMPGTEQPLAAGQLTVLRAGEPHAVLAEQDSCVLLTLLLPAH